MDIDERHKKVETAKQKV